MRATDGIVAAVVLVIACGRTPLAAPVDAQVDAGFPLDGAPKACEACPHACCADAKTGYFCADSTDCYRWQEGGLSVNRVSVCRCEKGQDECAWRLDCAIVRDGKRVRTDRCFDTSRRCHWDDRIPEFGKEAGSQ